MQLLIRTILLLVVGLSSCRFKHDVSFEDMKRYVSKDAVHKLKEIKISDQDGVELLKVAAGHGSFKCAEYLLDIGVPVDAFAKHDIHALPPEWTPFFIAVFNRNTEVAKLLIDRGANINYEDNNYRISVLHVATSLGMADVVKKMIERGVVVNRLNGNGRTPLHLAATKNLSDIAFVLVRDGDAVRWAKDVFGRTPYDIAKAKGYTNLFEILEYSEKYVQDMKNHDILLDLK